MGMIKSGLTREAIECSLKKREMESKISGSEEGRLRKMISAVFSSILSKDMSSGSGDVAACETIVEMW